MWILLGFDRKPRARTGALGQRHRSVADFDAPKMTRVETSKSERQRFFSDFRFWGERTKNDTGSHFSDCGHRCLDALLVFGWPRHTQSRGHRNKITNTKLEPLHSEHRLYILQGPIFDNWSLTPFSLLYTSRFNRRTVESALTLWPNGEPPCARKSQSEVRTPTMNYFFLGISCWVEERTSQEKRKAKKERGKGECSAGKELPSSEVKQSND